MKDDSLERAGDVKGELVLVSSPDEVVGRPERKADGRVDLWEEGQPCAARRTGLDQKDVAREGGVLQLLRGGVGAA